MVGWQSLYFRNWSTSICIIWFLDITSTAGDELEGSTSNLAPVELTTEAGEGSVANDFMPLPKGSY